MSHSGLRHVLITSPYHFTCKEIPSNKTYAPLLFRMYAVSYVCCLFAAMDFCLHAYRGYWATENSRGIIFNIGVYLLTLDTSSFLIHTRTNESFFFYPIFRPIADFILYCLVCSMDGCKTRWRISAQKLDVCPHFPLSYDWMHSPFKLCYSCLNSDVEMCNNTGWRGADWHISNGHR